MATETVSTFDDAELSARLNLDREFGEPAFNLASLLECVHALVWRVEDLGNR